MPRASFQVTAADTRRLLPDALQRPAPEGARLVALHYLQQLEAARTAWARFADANGPAAAPEDVLHDARVALRRLRATLRQHERVLGDAAAPRFHRALRALGRATNAQRDADVQLGWLDAQREHLPRAAQAEAGVLRERLARRQHRHGRHALERTEAAFVRHLDPIVEPLSTRLSQYVLVHRVGVDPEPALFARHLADRVARGATRLHRELGRVQQAGDQDAMHRARIRFKQARALVAPFAPLQPAIGAWFDAATRAQDRLGLIRDLHLLRERAHSARLTTLADAIADISLGYFAAFHEEWLANPEQALASAARAVEVLRSARYRHSPTPALPIEIERKYLLRGCPPEARAIAPDFIEQGWLPGTTLRERLRRRTTPDGAEHCTRTIKLGAADARIEVEEETSADLFASLWPLTNQARVRKHRHVVPTDLQTWEIDVFADRDLVLAEVELDAIDESAPLPPWLVPWVVREVTTDPTYLNSALARPEP